MAVMVRKIVLWRSEVENKPGVLAGVLEPLAKAGADLQVVMGYRYTGIEAKAAIELYPVAGKKVVAAAQQAGLSASSIPALLIEGDNRPGLGYALAQALADVGINLAFMVAHVVGSKYSAIVGLETEADTAKAASLIKAAVKKGTEAKKKKG